MAENLMMECATSNFRAEKMKTEAAGSSETYLPNKKKSCTYSTLY
jgi:hypothetical protein